MRTTLEIATRYKSETVAVDFGDRDEREDLRIRILGSGNLEWLQAAALGLVEGCKELATLRDQDANQAAARLRASEASREASEAARQVLQARLTRAERSTPAIPPGFKIVRNKVFHTREEAGKSILTGADETERLVSDEAAS